MRRFFLLAMLSLSLATRGAAREIYVSNVAGDDTATGIYKENLTPRGGPVRSIAKALRLAQRGDRIVLADTGVVYRESLSLVGGKHSGSELAPFMIEGNGATLDGSMPVPNDAWEHFLGDVFRFRPDRLGHQQLFLQGKPAVRRPTSGLDYALPTLAPGEWCLSLGYIYFCVDPGQVPQAYKPSFAALQTGVTLYQVHGVEIRNLVVQGFQLDGVNAFDSVFGARLSGLTCRGNGRSGISAGGATRVEIDDCLVGNNGAAQIRTEGFTRTAVSASQVIGNTAPAFVVDGGSLLVDGKEPAADEQGEGSRAEEL